MPKVDLRTAEVDSYWQMEDHVLTDILTISAFTDPKKFVQSVRRPNIVVTKKIPKKKSIYDEVSSEDELDDKVKIQEEIKKNIPMGRGYVIQKYQKRHVGAHSQTIEETQRSIREIFPVGFSNEVIEAAYKNPKPLKVVPEPMEQLRFRPASSGSSSSSSNKDVKKYDDDVASNSTLTNY